MNNDEKEMIKRSNFSTETDKERSSTDARKTKTHTILPWMHTQPEVSEAIDG
uniref:Uncharacterized protein n=1 Tax=Arion vulgaris TaxID=1028688 RepID=A0A0B6YV68_9EUPU